MARGRATRQGKGGARVSVEIESSHEGRVETWWLNRPEARNAVSLDMWRAVADNADRVRADRKIRVVVVRGRGGHFSAGADIAQLGRSLASDAEGGHYRATNARAERALSSLPLPTVAAIEGFCIGGGVQLALSCDLRVATSSSRFAITPAKLGIAYPAAALQRLVAAVGPSHASELLLTADMIDAPRAHAIGLVNRLHDDLDSAVDELVTTLLSRSAFTQAATKSIIDALLNEVDIAERGREWERRSLEVADFAEGAQAFAEKRDPSFRERPPID